MRRGSRGQDWEVKQAGKIRGECTFQRVEVSHAEVGGPVSVWRLLSQKGRKCIRIAALGSRARQRDLWLPELPVIGTRGTCSLDSGRSRKGSVWRWGDGRPDMGVLVQMLVCVCVCVCTHTRVSAVSSDAPAAPADSEPSSGISSTADTQGRTFWNVVCTWVQRCLDWGPFLFPKCPPAYSSPDTPSLTPRKFSLSLCQRSPFSSPFLRINWGPGF